ncbi:hypothetical protein CPB83DRAFT_840172 [Crepidotus variabilis]|uniref:Uncharacterized protein n=1 Tax=Crepidotus variabilis TaxID=179855 RepID=A0A9P6E5F4_9AGAR|nr:hypothetical protein CPB83DRAFT_840172 [Crepidotus variabilis]
MATTVTKLTPNSSKRTPTPTPPRAQPTSINLAGHDISDCNTQAPPNRTRYDSSSVSLHASEVTKSLDSKTFKHPNTNSIRSSHSQPQPQSGLYTHLNTSGVFANSDDPSPPVPQSVIHKKPSLRRTHKGQRTSPSMAPTSSTSPSPSPAMWMSTSTSSTRKTPSRMRSLVRNRIKIWNVTRLGYPTGNFGSGIWRIQEEDEEDSADSGGLARSIPPNSESWTSEPLHPTQLQLHLQRDQPPSSVDMPDHEEHEESLFSPRHSSIHFHPLSLSDWQTDPIPPCPMSVIDEGSDSSDSSSSCSSSGASEGENEDLDAYNFHFSPCYSTLPGALVQDLQLDLDDVVDRALAPSLKGANAPTRLSTKPTSGPKKSNATSRRRNKSSKVIIKHDQGDEQEIDISSVYASIMRDMNTRTTSLGLVKPSWMYSK